MRKTWMGHKRLTIQSSYNRKSKPKNSKGNDIYTPDTDNWTPKNIKVTELSLINRTPINTNFIYLFCS